MIDRLTLENFTAFRELDIDFSAKINVIIGENGTGKTHLLKAAYAMCDCIDPLINIPPPKSAEIERMLGESFVKIFNPDIRRLGRLVNRTSRQDANITFLSNEQHLLECNFGSRSVSNAKVIKNKEFNRYGFSPVYIPAKEVLSFYRGMRDQDVDQDLLDKLFDATYINLCSQLSCEPAKELPEMLSDPRLGTVYPKITNAIGGQYSLSNETVNFTPGTFVEFQSRKQHKLGDKVESRFMIHNKDFTDPLATSLTAEGFRKIGTLQMLLLNRSINPGGSGPLFWDEPESNMNPKLMKTVVEVLLELSRNGQQIILATHDYIILKWFDLLMDSGKEDHVRYHALYRDEKSGDIRLDSVDDYRALPPNAIADTFNDLTKEQVRRNMGGLGK